MKEWLRIEITFEGYDKVGFSREEFERMLKVADMMQDLERIKQIGKTMCGLP